MRQSSNHKVPTIPPESVWSEGIHIDYGDAYPAPTVDKRAKNDNIQPFSSRARPVQENTPTQKQATQNRHPRIQERRSTDYWNDSFLDEHSNDLNNRVSVQGRSSERAFTNRPLENDPPESDHFEVGNFEKDNFEQDTFEANAFEYGEFEHSGFDEPVDDLDFPQQNRHVVYHRDLDDDDLDNDELDEDDLDNFTDDLTQSLFSEVEECRRSSRNPRNLSGNIKRRVKHQLEQRLVKIVLMPNSADYLNQLIKIFDGAVSSLTSACSPSISGLQSQFLVVRSLTKRYAIRGLEELAVLEDVIDIYPQASLSDFSVLLIGLAARIVLKPRLNKQEIDPVLVKKLFAAIAEAVKRLAANRQLKALPGLAASLGYISMRDGHATNQLPQLFYRAAVKVTKNPQLYQRLCSFRKRQPASPSATRPAVQTGERTEIPQRLRLSGPVEIFIRHLGEN